MDKVGETLSSVGGGNGQGQDRPQSDDVGRRNGGGGSTGFLGSIGDMLSSATGRGGGTGKNEDQHQNGNDLVQEKGQGQGPQDSGSAVEQATDEQISDFIREKYQSTAVSDQPIKDKGTRSG